MNNLRDKMPELIPSFVIAWMLKYAPTATAKQVVELVAEWRHAEEATLRESKEKGEVKS